MGLTDAAARSVGLALPDPERTARSRRVGAPARRRSSGGVGQVVGDASLHTGDATALGVNTGTSITQKVDATAAGRQHQCVAGRGGRERRPRRGEHGWERRGGCRNRIAGGGVNASADCHACQTSWRRLSGGTVEPRRHDGCRRPVRLRWSPRAADRARGDAIDQVVDSTPTDLVGPADDPAAPQTKHTRIRQVIGVLTFAFSSANGQDKSETTGERAATTTP